MKKLFFIAAGILSLASCSAEKNAANVTVSLPADAPKQLVVNRYLVKDMLDAKSRADLKIITDTVDVKDGEAEIPVDERGMTRYFVKVSDDEALEYFTEPGETLAVKVESLDPLAYSVTGSVLMEDITKLQKVTTPIMQEFLALGNSETDPTEEQVRDLMMRYEKAVTDFIKQNPKSPAVGYAMFDLEGESLMNAYNSATPEAKQSPLFVIAAKPIEGDKEQAAKERELENKIKEMADGTHAAPVFTLKDLEGKDVSLTQFRGKWVILDFWGSWCGWCIKGIPRLKEAYKEYAGRLEVIGIDCNESEE
ncbi:MAG: redoxin domain-containing protein, partial [Muribaculaceae bacterium]|nr:redoxin domain-containing protein [Muribaculaceae bacterium]